MAWPILGAIVVSTGNAISRKFFGVSSNAWLEIQWHLFALSSLGCAGYVLLVNEHVRVDVWSSRLHAAHARLDRRWPGCCCVRCR